MKYPIFFFVFILVMIVGLTMMFTNYDNPITRLNNIMAEQPLDDCYDDSMEAWFIEFNKSQEAGVSMEEADNKAAKTALEEFNECHNNQ